eukprot:12537058-Alexandrium_andersonii.AAC.1
MAIKRVLFKQSWDSVVGAYARAGWRAQQKKCTAATPRFLGGDRSSRWPSTRPRRWQGRWRAGVRSPWGRTAR